MADPKNAMAGLKGSIALGPDETPPDGYELVGMKSGKRVYQPTGEVYGDKTRGEYQAAARPIAEQMQTRAPKKMYGEKTIAREEAARAAARQRVLDRTASREKDLAALQEREAAYTEMARPKQGATTPAEFAAFESDLAEAKSTTPAERQQLAYGVTPDRFAKQLSGVDLQTSAGQQEARKRLGLGRGQQVIPAAKRSLLDRLLGR